MKTIIPKISEIFRNTKWTDLVFKVTNEAFSCHRFILATAYPVLAEILGDTDNDNDEPATVIMSGFTSDDVRELIAFAYGNENLLKEDLRSALFFKIDKSISSEGCRNQEIKTESMLCVENEDSDEPDISDNFDDLKTEEEHEPIEDQTVTSHEIKEQPRVIQIMRPQKKIKIWPKKCPYCPKLSKDMYHYKRHLNSCIRKMKESNEPKLNCIECGQEFLRKDINIHMKNVHGSKSLEAEGRNYYVVCTLCGKEIQRRCMSLHLKIHRQKEQGIKWQCKHCPMQLSSKNALKDHEELHTTGTVYCPHCGKEFKSQRNVDRHIKVSHTEDCDKKFKCHHLLLAVCE